MTMTVIPMPGTGVCVGGACQAPAQRIVAVSGPVTTSDNILLVQHAAPVTLTLPTGATADQWFVIKDFDGDATANNITIATAGGDTIDLSSAYTLDVDFMSVTIGCDGAGRYFVI